MGWLTLECTPLRDGIFHFCPQSDWIFPWYWKGRYDVHKLVEVFHSTLHADISSIDKQNCWAMKLAVRSELSTFPWAMKLFARCLPVEPQAPQCYCGEFYTTWRPGSSPPRGIKIQCFCNSDGFIDSGYDSYWLYLRGEKQAASTTS